MLSFACGMAVAFMNYDYLYKTGLVNISSWTREGLRGKEVVFFSGTAMLPTLSLVNNPLKFF